MRFTSGEGGPPVVGGPPFGAFAAVCGQSNPSCARASATRSAFMSVQSYGRVYFCFASF